VKLERRSPTVYRITLHAYELAMLVSAARWAAEGGVGEMSGEARAQLQDLVDAYNSVLAHVPR
jgi:hypothetical protein